MRRNTEWSIRRDTERMANPRSDERDGANLSRQPRTRCQAIDEQIDTAYDAYDRDDVVVAMYWFVIVDLRGVRSFANEIMACVAKWNALGCPQQDECIGPDFSEDQYGLGWAAMLWFGQMTPEIAINWIVKASIDGNRDARMFGFKFLGPNMFQRTSNVLSIRDSGFNPATVLGFMTFVVVLLVLLLAFVVYIFTAYSGA